MPDRRPQYDDEEHLGISFFRRSVVGDLSNLTLPRTFFGRSEIRDTRFRNTDLRESNFCWNDFVGIDFSHAVLRDCDLRASMFERVSFVEADLASADLRRSRFTNCRFDRASMEGAVLTREQGKTIALSAAQIAAVKWVDNEGEEPEGG
ncbi:MAG: pentapeptide repeat-containing protein [Alphaproteobacteria bacterium]|nr:pentapeptide repeat-containing protein [Alphaproteobacteria bacterium]